MSPDEYCEQKAAASGSSFYHSFRFLPPDRRRAIIALYAFCREVDDAVDETIDAAVARIKLEWWRSQVAAIFGGAPQHPVAQALKPVVKAYELPQEHLLAVIDGMGMDLDLDRYPDFGLLERYCDRVAGVVGLMSAKTRIAAASICRRTRWSASRLPAQSCCSVASVRGSSH